MRLLDEKCLGIQSHSGIITAEVIGASESMNELCDVGKMIIGASKNLESADFIKPCDFNKWDSETKRLWISAMTMMQSLAYHMYGKGISDKECVMCLPGYLACNFTISGDMVMWRNVFNLTQTDFFSNQTIKLLYQIMEIGDSVFFKESSFAVAGK